MNYQHVVGIEDNGFFAVSVMGYKPDEPLYNKIFPDADSELTNRAVLHIRRSEKAVASFSESEVRFVMVVYNGKRKVLPKRDGNYRRCIIDVASDKKEEAMIMMKEICEAPEEFVSFDQKMFFREDMISERLRQLIDFYRSQE